MRTAGLLCVLLLSVTNGDDLRALIEEALDQPVHLEIQDLPLAEAFQRVAAETGVEVTVGPAALGVLPYGENTKVSATMGNISLREGLSKLTVPLGLRFEVRERSIEVLPNPALLRLGRQATWDELDTLAGLHAMQFRDRPATIDALGATLQFRVGQAAGWPPLRAAIERVGAGPGDEVLTLACDALDWTWYPSGKQIAVVLKADQLRRQLDWPVSIRMTHRKLIDVLQAIGRETGVTVRAEPGAIASLPLHIRNNFMLHVENASAKVACEYVAGASGLGYRIDPDAVVFFNPGAEPGPRESVAQPPRGVSDPYVGKITLPAGPHGAQVDIFIRASDLSAETNRLRQRFLEQADEAMKKALQGMTENVEP